MKLLKRLLLKYRISGHFFYGNAKTLAKNDIGSYINSYVASYHKNKSTKAPQNLYKSSLNKSLLSTNDIKKGQLPYTRFNSGFNLVELIVTVCIMAIIATIATPFVITQLTRMEAKRIRYAITTTLATAKAESYIRRQNLIICLSDLQGRCHKNSDKDLLLFLDNNGDENFDVGTDELLAQQRLDPKYAQLKLRAGNRHYVKFWGDSGKPRGFFGHIKYCPVSTYNRSMYQISFNQVGIIKYKPNVAHPTGC